MNTQERTFRSKSAEFQAALDHDWRYFEDHVEELEEAAELDKSDIMKAAVGMVIVQIYNNRITRMLDERYGTNN